MANKEVIKKWVDALRSGEYKQTDGALRKEDGFCCLGVLCDLASQEGVIEEPVFFDECCYYEYEGCEVEDLPDKVQEWAGLSSCNPKFAVIFKYVDQNDEEYEDEYTTSITQLNDDYGYNFNMLADLIEKEYLTGE